MIRHLRKGETMSTYETTLGYLSDKSRVSWRWPLVVTGIMLAAAFVPYLGLLNLLLLVPMALVIFLNFAQTNRKNSRLVMAFLLLLSSVAVTVVVNIATMFQVTPG